MVYIALGSPLLSVRGVCERKANSGTRKRDRIVVRESRSGVGGGRNLCRPRAFWRSPQSGPPKWKCRVEGLPRVPLKSV